MVPLMRFLMHCTMFSITTNDPFHDSVRRFKCPWLLSRHPPVPLWISVPLFRQEQAPHTAIQLPTRSATAEKMSQPERLLENSLSVASSRLMSAPGSCKADGQYASSAQTQHLSRGKRKRADGYSEVDNKFIIQSVQSADEEGKPIPWDWIGSNLQRTTGAVKKQYQRIKPSLDKIVVSVYTDCDDTAFVLCGC